MISKEVFWDDEKNTIDESELTFGSERKVWWLCDKNHSWETYYRNVRKLSRGCPYCAGRKVLVGFNNLFHTNPELKELWDFKKNEINPNEITAGSCKKVWWKCQFGHSWKSILSTVVNGCRCPYCANRKLLNGFNDLISKNPELLEEWDYDKNTIKPNEVVYSSYVKVWWKCKNNHSWRVPLKSRTRDGDGCRKCPRKPRKVSPEKSFAALHPNLVKEFHPTKNKNLKPEELFECSPKRIWWICKIGHEWETFLYSRTKGGTGCPYCVGYKVLKGFNDLSTVNPDLAKLWHPTKNGDLTPEMLTVGSDKKVWWLCKNGHSTITTIHSRHVGYGCKKCSNNISQKERDLSDFVKTVVNPEYKILTNVRNVINPKELDLYIPELKFAIEFNGNHWHDKSRWLLDLENDTLLSPEALKTSLCNDLGIELLHVWEDEWDNDNNVVKSLIKNKFAQLLRNDLNY